MTRLHPEERPAKEQVVRDLRAFGRDPTCWGVKNGGWVSE